jgi:hypothetical protein
VEFTEKDAAGKRLIVVERQAMRELQEKKVADAGYLA